LVVGRARTHFADIMKISLVLFSYNHQEFIRPALADFLSQAGEGFEFIISDDCSTDDTWQIINSETQKIKNKNAVKIWRTQHNAGYLDNINYVISKTDSDIIIPFAADDRFFPNRAMELSKAMVSSDAWLAHSDCNFIDRLGNPTASLRKGILFYGDYSVREAALSHALFIGATAGWSRRLFTKYGPIPANLAYEDLILGFRAALENGVVYVDQKLMSYRTGVGTSFEVRAKAKSKEEYRRERIKFYQRKIDTLNTRINDLNHPEFNDFKHLRIDIIQEKSKLELIKYFLVNHETILNRDFLKSVGIIKYIMKEYRRISKYKNVF
jgi:glycosyltransferase involved in cell wall biosynthesis